MIWNCTTKAFVVQIKVVTVGMMYELKRLDQLLTDVATKVLCKRLYRWLRLEGIVHQHVTHVAQNTSYKASGVDKLVVYVNKQIVSGNFGPLDLWTFGNCEHWWNKYQIQYNRLYKPCKSRIKNCEPQINRIIVTLHSSTWSHFIRQETAPIYYFQGETKWTNYLQMG